MKRLLSLALAVVSLIAVAASAQESAPSLDLGRYQRSSNALLVGPFEQHGAVRVFAHADHVTLRNLTVIDGSRAVFVPVYTQGKPWMASVSDLTIDGFFVDGWTPPARTVTPDRPGGDPNTEEVLLVHGRPGVPGIVRNLVIRNGVIRDRGWRATTFTAWGVSIDGLLIERVHSDYPINLHLDKGKYFRGVVIRDWWAAEPRIIWHFEPGDRDMIDRVVHCRFPTDAVHEVRLRLHPQLDHPTFQTAAGALRYATEQAGAWARLSEASE